MPPTQMYCVLDYNFCYTVLSNHEKISLSFYFRLKMLTAFLASIFELKQNVKGRSHFFIIIKNDCLSGKSFVVRIKVISKVGVLFKYVNAILSFF